MGEGLGLRGSSVSGGDDIDIDIPVYRAQAGKSGAHARE